MQVILYAPMSDKQREINTQLRDKTLNVGELACLLVFAVCLTALCSADTGGGEDSGRGGKQGERKGGGRGKCGESRGAEKHATTGARAGVGFSGARLACALQQPAGTWRALRCRLRPCRCHRLPRCPTQTRPIAHVHNSAALPCCRGSQEAMNKLGGGRKGGGASLTSLNNVLMQMRKNCNHPDLITAPFEGGWVRSSALGLSCPPAN